MVLRIDDYLSPTNFGTLFRVTNLWIDENEGLVSGTDAEDVINENSVEELHTSHQEDIPETAEMSLLEIMEKEAADVMKSLADSISDAEGVDDSLRIEHPQASKMEESTEPDQVVVVTKNEDEEGIEKTAKLNPEHSLGMMQTEAAEAGNASEANIEVRDASAESTGKEENDEALLSTNESIVQDITDGESEREKIRLEESRIVGGDIVFDGSRLAYSGWDSLRWMSYSGIRKIKLFQHVFRYEEKSQKTLFWATVDKEYVPRVLAIYEEPSLILVLRRPTDEEEVHRLVGSSGLGDCWIVESVVDPATCKLRLSNLTHSTSTVEVEEPDERSRSLFEIISPAEKIRLSAVQPRDQLKRAERSFSDSGAFFETNAVESSLVGIICDAHRSDADVHDESLLQHQGTKIG
jgi:hypothetical protein